MKPISRFSVLAACALLSAPAPAAAQDFASIDAHALATPLPDDLDVRRLAADLSRPARTDAEKARVIYRWITENIEYDTETFFSGDLRSVDVRSVLRERRAVCDGYARLFQALAQEMGLRTEVVTGHAKGLGAGAPQPGRPNHAWNAVRIDGRWRLVDATWGAGFVDGRGFRKSFRDYYFLVAPEQLVFSHLPEDGRWQLVRPRVTPAEFTATPVLSSYLFEQGFAAAQIREALAHGHELVKPNAVPPADVRFVMGPVTRNLAAGSRMEWVVESAAADRLDLVQGTEWKPLARFGTRFHYLGTLPPGRWSLVVRVPGATGGHVAVEYVVRE